MREALYIVQCLDKDQWMPTWWTCAHRPSTGGNTPPAVVTLAQALTALKRAQTASSRGSFRLFPVADRSRRSNG
jgi:hypothetical protein